MEMQEEARRKYFIKLRDLEDMKAFVNAARELKGICEVVSGRYRVNAKSLMAVLAIPISGILMMEVEQAQENLPQSLQRYLY